MHSRAILDRKVVDIPDVERAPADLAVGAKNFLRSGLRAITIVPLMQGDRAIGALSVVRAAPGPLSDKQLATLKTYADQAVIAIENTRLLNELRQRSTDLTESLEQQTATSEVLKVISSSRGELEPVFSSVLANAVRICGAKFGVLFLWEGETRYRVTALEGAPPRLAERRRPGTIIRAAESTGLAIVASTQQTAHIYDVQTVKNYFDPPPGFDPAGIVVHAGARVELAVPMLKESELVGAIVIYRTEVLPFTDKQIDLVKNFAAQAVIAVENARLLSELRESLQQQTATADVLKVISTSPGELEPVFQTVLENATRICGANFANLLLYENGAFRRAALFGAPSAWQEGAFRDPVIRPNEINPIFRIIKNKEIVIIS